MMYFKKQTKAEIKADIERILDDENKKKELEKKKREQQLKKEQK